MGGEMTQAKAFELALRLNEMYRNAGLDREDYRSISAIEHLAGSLRVFPEATVSESSAEPAAPQGDA